MNTTAIATYLEAEVRCFHCGHNSGYLRRDQGPTAKLAVFVPSDGSPNRAVRSLTEIRCGRCQGSVCMAGVAFLCSLHTGRPPEEIRIGPQDATLGVGRA